MASRSRYPSEKNPSNEAEASRSYPPEKMPSKEEEASQSQSAEDEEPLSSPENSRPASVVTLDPAPPTLQDEDDPAPAYGPTVQSPFNFPTAELPPYSPPTTAVRPFAFPQTESRPTSTFLSAYSPGLLAYGIPPESWRSFTQTVNAFLTAAVSKKAISHAADVANSFASVPKRFITDTAMIGRSIGASAKQGNPVGVIGGTLRLTVGTVGRAVGTIFQLPGAAVHAAVQEPKTPRARAEAYVLAANKDWFNSRGLVAHIISSSDLAFALNVKPGTLLSAAQKPEWRHAGEQLNALTEWIGDVELPNDADSPRLRLDNQTLWLVLFPNRNVSQGRNST